MIAQILSAKELEKLEQRPAKATLCTNGKWCCKPPRLESHPMPLLQARFIRRT